MDQSNGFLYSSAISEKKRNVYLCIFFFVRYVQPRSQALFLPSHWGESPGTRLRHVSRSGSRQKNLRPLPQSNNTVFVTCLSLLFSVASFSGEIVRGDTAADIADRTVSLQRIHRPLKFEVVFAGQNVS